MAREDDQSTGVAALEPTLKLRTVELTVVDGPDRGAKLRVAQGRARLGTAARVDLRLADPMVSRLHCEIDVGRDRVRIVDQGSTNGTFLGAVRVHDAEVPSGADLRIGATTVRIELGDRPTFVQLSMRHRYGPLVGASVEMRRIYALLDRVGPADSTVLIQGETGTGKELVARTVHDASPRAAGPFVAVDCGSIAENLIESELFGHVRGAFSGAVSDRRGVLEEANGGTVFFDEVGELPLSLQPKLLRVLEAREVRPVGSNAARRLDVRVVAATNRPLARAVNEGAFREDLYYRLAVVEIELPPLRARREDIKALAQHFYERFAGEGATTPPELLATLLARSWPGNVRELRNFVERSVLFGWSGGGAALQAHEPGAGAAAVHAVVNPHLPLKDARAAWLEQFDSLYVRALLAETGGNVTRAADLAGLNRRSLQRLMVRLGLRTEDDPDGGG